MKNEPKPKLECVALVDIKPNLYRARKHSPRTQKTLEKAIRENGQCEPPIVDEGNHILHGTERVQAFRNLGYTHIYVNRVSHLDEEQKMAFSLAAGKLPQNAMWDKGALQEIFLHLSVPEIDIDLELTGFDQGEIDIVMLEDNIDPTNEPKVPLPPQTPNTRVGDIFQLGKHRLICGNSLEREVWRKLMLDELAAACFTDPPYNVPTKGHVTSKDHANFAMAHGEKSPEEFVEFLLTGLGLVVEFSRDGALHYICMDHGHLRELYAACDEIYSRQLNLIVWNKTNAGMGSFYRSRHELIPIFKVGTAKHINNVQLGRYGRNRSNVWTYEGANTFRRDRDKDLADHPTVKPVAMVADALLDCTHLNDIVVDGFGGSGTLILAAERTRRRARVIEYEPKYCDVAIRRWEEMTGEKAVLIGSGGTLALPAPQKLLPPPADGVAHA